MRGALFFDEELLSYSSILKIPHKCTRHPFLSSILGNKKQPHALLVCVARRTASRAPAALATGRLGGHAHHRCSTPTFGKTHTQHNLPHAYACCRSQHRVWHGSGSPTVRLRLARHPPCYGFSKASWHRYASLRILRSSLRMLPLIFIR